MSPVLIKEQNSAITGQSEFHRLPDEVMAFCPICKTHQTIFFEGNSMIPTRKFRQDGEQVYHDCSSVRPCRLYRGS